MSEDGDDPALSTSSPSAVKPRKTATNGWSPHWASPANGAPSTRSASGESGDSAPMVGAHADTSSAIPRSRTPALAGCALVVDVMSGPRRPSLDIRSQRRHATRPPHRSGRRAWLTTNRNRPIRAVSAAWRCQHGVDGDEGEAGHGRAQRPSRPGRSSSATQPRRSRGRASARPAVPSRRRPPGGGISRVRLLVRVFGGTRTSAPIGVRRRLAATVMLGRLPFSLTSGHARPSESEGQGLLGSS